MDASELIAQVQAAAEGSTELDRAISEHLIGQADSYPPYTRSIDAALTLVLEGWSWGIGLHIRDHLPAPLSVAVVEKAGTGVVNPAAGEYHEVELENRPPALAICIAALKARTATISTQ